MPEVIVVGGGIGGLTAAIALQRRGIDAQVYEAAPELRAVGAGITVPPNAMQVLARLMLADEIAATGVSLARLQVRDVRGRVLSDLDGAEATPRWGFPPIAIRRSELQRVLASALRPHSLHLDKRLLSVTEGEGSVRVQFVDGSDAAGAILIGADGLHSTVRNRLFPRSTIRYAGQTCFRGLAETELPPDLRRAAWEIWGGSIRFGFAPVSAGQVYWFAPIASPVGVVVPPHHVPALLRERFASFPAPIPALIAATPPGAIIQTDIFDLAPLRQWHSARVALLGDAAHATTPNLGQGGAQAIEDALALASRLAEHGLTTAALAQFQQARLPRARHIVRLSRAFGRMAHLESRLLRAARNAMLLATPVRVQQRQLDNLFTPSI